MEDGPMIVRKLWAWEWEKLRAHLLRLDPEDRRLRFLRPAGDNFIHRYCDEIDRGRTTAVGAFIGGTLRGAAELVRIPEGVPAAAELALSVEHEFQGQGIGGKLLQKALLIARNRFTDTVQMLSLRENERIQRLVRRFGASVLAYDSATEGKIHLPWPSYVSMLEEAATDGQAMIGAVFEIPVEEFGTVAAGASEDPALPR
jgi:ribosomal protein S18 acetylase RimI-like enzyme